jgi:uncharacterized protein YjiS (DUF1127 family)
MPTILRQSGSSATGRPALSGTIDAFGWAVGLLVRWEERARQRHQLAGLDDRMLRDIGIDRLTAQSESLKPFWRL